ncbi:hypothetical protein OCAR_4916 [Afipia carboxidovorans OM5]|nr:hypothetical protein OCAR_4916 [Afipia carboxidovorans OM5]
MAGSRVCKSLCMSFTFVCLHGVCRQCSNGLFAHDAARAFQF